MKQYVTVSVKEINEATTHYLTYTYQDATALAVGALVLVPVRTKQSLAVVVSVSKHLPATLKNVPLKPVIRCLSHPPLSPHYIELADWLSDYYCASARTVWQAMLPSGLASQTRLRTDLPSFSLPRPFSHRLTAEQSQALTQTERSTKPVLLYGVTGSGKTELFVHLAEKAISQQKSCLILVPEISLAPQKVAYFQSIFGSRVIVTHSKLSAARRRAIWLSILHTKEPVIVIGPRSALFMPFAKLGLIVIDEAHEPSYKQSTAPRYQTTHVAAKLASLHGAKLVLASATPLITDYYYAQLGRLSLVTLEERIHQSHMPEIKLIQLQKGHPLITEELKQAIAKTLAKKLQVMLFLNRRGSASSYVCTHCSSPVRCPRCGSLLSFHADDLKLVCHICNFRENPPVICPHCGAAELVFVGTGTKKVEQQLSNFFAGTTIERIDSDSLAKTNIEETITRLNQASTNIIVGTQVIAKGHDFAGVDLVGIMLAEQSLMIPDYLAAERTFDLITQVAGRTGRNKTSPGQVIVQSYVPNHPVIRFATSHDYAGFYNWELANRKKYNYPPFVYLLRLIITTKQDKTAYQKADELAQELRRQHHNLTVLGPSQPLHPISRSGHSWQIIIKAKHRSLLTAIAKQHKSEWTIDLDPITII